MPFPDGHGRQVDAVGDIADGIDGVDVGAAKVIHHDGSIGGGCHPGRLQPQPGGVWLAAGAQDDSVHFQHLTIAGADLQPACGLVDAAHFVSVAQLDMALLHVGGEQRRNVLVEPAQQVRPRTNCVTSLPIPAKMPANSTAM
jgi:hypothetical protein